jgi:hypothetical protein
MERCWEEVRQVAVAISANETFLKYNLINVIYRLALFVCLLVTNVALSKLLVAEFSLLDI